MPKLKPDLQYANASLPMLNWQTEPDEEVKVAAHGRVIFYLGVFLGAVVANILFLAVVIWW